MSQTCMVAHGLGSDPSRNSWWPLADQRRGLAALAALQQLRQKPEASKAANWLSGGPVAMCRAAVHLRRHLVTDCSSKRLTIN